jgi:tryptophan synthase beta chain
VLLHQTIIGQEALATGDGCRLFDLVIGCMGAAPTSAAWRSRSSGEARRPAEPHDPAVEPASGLSLTRGEYRYDFGDTAGFTPLMKMHTFGHDFVST